MTKDHKGRVWIGTANGINTVTSQNDSTFTIHQYGNADGVPDVEMTNQIRSDVTNEGIAMTNRPDAACKNYWFPEGYIDGLEMNSDAISLYQGPHNTFWCYEGDEFNITSNAGNYDVTIEIPPLPEGNYQVRLGFANMSTRGICQFYYDGEPMGAPLDMREHNFEERTGWKDIWSGMNPCETPTTDEALAVMKDMHRRGWYHGPEDVFCFLGEGHEDGDPTVGKNYFSRFVRTCRYVLGNQPVEIKNDGKKHTIRIKSVQAATGTVIMLDYLEFVPESEWGDYDPSIDPSAVDELKASGVKAGENAPIYDFNGRRLTEKPANGYYIQGGKKFFVE